MEVIDMWSLQLRLFGYFIICTSCAVILHISSVYNNLMYIHMHSFLESWVVFSLVFSSESCSVWTILPIYLTQLGNSQFLHNTSLHGITKELHFIYLLFICFIFVYARSSLLCGLFSSCGQWGLLSICVAWDSIAVASLVAEHGLV